MTEQPAAQVPADDRDAIKVRKMGKTCILFFVIFMICLLSFGRSPVTRNVVPGGFHVNFYLDFGDSRVNVDLISCLCVAAGVFALVFLLKNVKRILSLPAGKKVLGLVGCLGLVAHAFLALVVPLSYGAAPVTGAGGAGPTAAGGPEQWTIDGKTYDITSTYYLSLTEGFQYTIEYPCQFAPDENIDEQRALAIGFPMMKHAYANGLFRRISVTKMGEGQLMPSRIGVVLYQKTGQGVRGYKVALTLEQIKTRIEREISSGTKPS